MIPTPEQIGPIVIKTDLDLTPAGKRSARVISVRGPMGRGRQLRWYVSGKIYDKMPVTHENIELTRKWMAMSYPPRAVASAAVLKTENDNARVN